MAPSTDDKDFDRKSALFSRRDILVSELSVVKISIQTHLLSSYFHWICVANLAKTSHHVREIDK